MCCADVVACALLALRCFCLSVCSHEIRTPMNGVLGAAELFDPTSSVQEQRDLIGIIKSSGAAMMILINDVSNGGVLVHADGDQAARACKHVDVPRAHTSLVLCLLTSSFLLLLVVVVGRRFSTSARSKPVRSRSKIVTSTSVSPSRVRSMSSHRRHSVRVSTSLRRSHHVYRTSFDVIRVAFDRCCSIYSRIQSSSHRPVR